MKPRLPTGTFCIASLAALVWLLPNLASRLIYDRDAILAGEVWRLWTGYLVHFSASHFVLDLAAFAACGWLLETRTRISRPLFFFGAPLWISLALLVLVPNMTRYGGLSALVVSALVCVALTLVKEGQGMRWIGWAALVLLAAKTGYELNASTALFADMSSVQVAPASHLAGSAAALIAWVTTGGNGSMRPRSQPLTSS